MKVRIKCPHCAGKGCTQEAGRWPTCPMCNGAKTLEVDGVPIDDIQVEFGGTPGREHAVVTGSNPDVVRRVVDQLNAAKHNIVPDAAGTMTIGTKHDDGKPPMGLLPWDALTEVAKVLDYGAVKYSVNGWRDVRPCSRYLDAAFRHLGAFVQEGDLDDESGLPHLAHAACCVLFLLSFYTRDLECRHGG